MKALSIRQPYAALVLSGLKTLEIRSWKTRYRGPLLIHIPQSSHSNFAGWGDQKKGDKGQMMVSVKIFDELIGKEVETPYIDFGLLEMCGGVFGMVEMTECLSKKEIQSQGVIDYEIWECAYAPMRDDSYAFVFENPRLISPLIVPGRVGMFTVNLEPEILW